MVACSSDHSAYIAGFTDRVGGKFGSGAFYLYFILIMKRRKQFETLAAIVLLLLALARWQKSWNYVYVAGVIVLTGLAWKGFSEKLHIAWMKLAEGLGFVSGKIILTLVFFLILIPVSFFAKRAGKLNIRLKSDERTEFKERNHKYAREDFENPW